MNGLPYYKAYPRDFFEGTRGMRGELKGAYRMALDMIYQHGGRLYNDPRHIAGELGYSVKKWNSLLSELVEMGKLRIESGIISNFRASFELENLKIMQDKQRENASKPRKNNNIPKAMAEPKPSHTEPDTDTDKKEKNPPNPPEGGVVALRIASDLDAEFDRVWSAYPRKVGHGQAKRAWIKARRKTEFETIAGPLREFIRVARGTEKDKVPHFSTWLNGERWLDDQTHARNGPRKSTDDLRELATISPAEDVARLFGGIQRKAIAQ